MKNFRLLSIIMILLLVITAVSGCATKENDETASGGDGAPEQAPAVVNTEGAIHIQIEIQDLGVVKADLYPEVAPETVANFTKLVSEGFYDGLTFHRVINGFMIQGGDPLGTGMGGSSDNVVGEFASNGFDNPLSHTKGVLSMARAGNDNDSASSQFFIVQSDANFLDGDYAAFGMVTEGMDIVDAIAADTPVEDDNGTVLPENQPVIKSVTILE